MNDMADYDHENQHICMDCRSWVVSCQHTHKPTMKALETEIKICHQLLTDAGVDFGQHPHTRIAELIVMLDDARRGE